MKKQLVLSYLLSGCLLLGSSAGVMVVCLFHPQHRQLLLGLLALLAVSVVLVLYITCRHLLMPLIRLKFREYPELVKLLDERHIQYNRMLDKIAYLEKEGRIHVIRPDRDISAKPVERDPAHLKEIYEVGRRVMKADMEKLKAYLAE